MKPRTRRSRRLLNYEPITKSVFKPSSEPCSDEESLCVDSTIDRDYDQIPLMIKRFMQGSGWTLDHFRMVLGDIGWLELTTFLEERGRKGGHRSRVYPLA